MHLSAPRPRARVRHSAFSWLFPIAAGAAVLAIAVVAFVYGPRFAPRAAPVKAAAPVSTGPKLRLYDADRAVPIVAPVNPDTTDDLIAMRWDDSDEARALWIVAHDGRTFEPIWRAGPFAIPWGSPRLHLSRGGDRLFLADGSDRLHVFELATGRELKVLTVAFRIDRMCADPKTHTAWVVRDEGHNAYLVDADTEAVRLEHAQPRWCRFSGQLPSCGFADHGEPCTYPSAPEARTVDFSSATTFLDGDDGVSVGTGKARKPIAEPTPFLVGFEAGTMDTRWEMPLVDRGETPHSDGTYKATVANGRLYAAYQLAGGKWSVTARDLKVGRTFFSTRVPGEEGSGLASFTVATDRVLVRMRRRLHVLDATDGRLLGSLE